MTLGVDWTDTGRNRQRQTETDRHKKKQDRNRETETEKPIPKVEIQPHTLFTHVFSPFFCFFGNVRKKTRDNPKYLSEESKNKSGAQKMSYFRNERKKRKVILVGQVVVTSVQLCMSTTCMGGQRAFPKKRKTKVVS